MHIYPTGEELPKVGSWRKVSVANCGECYDRKVGRVYPRPDFDIMIKGSSKANND